MPNSKKIRIKVGSKTATILWDDWVKIKQRFNIRSAFNYKGVYSRKIQRTCPLCERYHQNECRGCTFNKFRTTDHKTINPVGCNKLLHLIFKNEEMILQVGQDHISWDGDFEPGAVRQLKIIMSYFSKIEEANKIKGYFDFKGGAIE